MCHLRAVARAHLPAQRTRPPASIPLNIYFIILSKHRRTTERALLDVEIHVDAGRPGAALAWALLGAVRLPRGWADHRLRGVLPRQGDGDHRGLGLPHRD